MFFDRDTEEIFLFSFAVFIARTGFCIAFADVFVIHTDLFPTYILSTSFGVCNITARIVNISSAAIVEIPNKFIPILIIVILDILAALCTFFLRNKPHE